MSGGGIGCGIGGGCFAGPGTLHGGGAGAVWVGGGLSGDFLGGLAGDVVGVIADGIVERVGGGVGGVLIILVDLSQIFQFHFAINIGFDRMHLSLQARNKMPDKSCGLRQALRTNND